MTMYGEVDKSMDEVGGNNVPTPKTNAALLPFFPHAAERSQSSLLRVQLIRAPISIKTHLQNGTEEIWSHGLMFSHPKDDIIRLAVSISLIEAVFVHSDVVS